MVIYVAEGVFTDPKTGKKRRVKKQSAAGPDKARNMVSTYVESKYGHVTITFDKEYKLHA